MVKSPKNLAELKNLIQQAENNELLPDIKVRLESNIELNKSIQEVSLENWNKIRHVGPYWEELISQINRSGKLFNSNWNFASQEILEAFKRHINTNTYPTLETSNRGTVKIAEINENDVITTSWNNLREMLKNSQKIHGRDGDNCAFQSQETLQFLQSIISEEFLQNIEYQAGEEFKLSELKVPTREAQTYLEKYHSNQEITELDISKKGLEGSLDLSNFANLRKLYCSENKLTEIKFGNENNLEYLDARLNYLTDLNSLLVNLKPEKLKTLRIGDNNFGDFSEDKNNPSPLDLKPFSRFTNLEFLSIFSNYWQQEVYNRFSGSLEPLKDLVSLRQLEIDNTDIESGLEYLADSIESITCGNGQSPKAKVQNIAKEWDHFDQDIKKCQEFINSPAQQWLDKNYPQDKVGQRKTEEHPAKDEQLLIKIEGEEWRTQGKKRPDITHLNISNQPELKGGLRFEGFDSLKYLVCRNNQLTNLDLSDCEGLIGLDCSNNKFKNLNFFKDSGKNIISLDISNCPIEGSLEPLKNLNLSEGLNISKTNLREGLEYLPKTCQKLYCNSNYQYESSKIMEELDKTNCSEGEIAKNKYYNLDKWRADKSNGATSSAIPLERLFVIRSNFQQFLKKWGNEDKNNRTELSKLRSPEELKRFKGLEWVEYASTATTVAGGALTLIDFSTVGGLITLTAPLIGTGASQLKTSLFDVKQSRWEEFKTDADTFLDNYNALLGMLKQVEVGHWGQVNQALKNLKDEVKQFLKEYDHDGNEEIDIEELTKERAKFSNELGKVEGIVKALKELENKAVEYRQGKLTGKDEIRIEEEETAVDNDNSFQQIISELTEQIKVEEELKKAVKTEFEKNSPTQEIIFLLKGQENQVLVISRVQNNILNDLLPEWLNKNYVLDLVEKGEKVMKIRKNYSFPKQFNSQKEAVEKALELTEIKLTEQQERYIEERINKTVKDEKAKEKSLEEKQEKLTKLLESLLLEKGTKIVQEGKQNKNLDDKTAGKYTICSLCRLVNEYLNEEVKNEAMIEILPK